MESNKFTNEEIVQQFKDGKIALRGMEYILFDRLYIPFTKKMKNRHRILAKQDISEAFNNAFIYLLLKIQKEDFEVQKSIAALFYKIFDFKCIDLVKKIQTEERKKKEQLPLPSPSDRNAESNEAFKKKLTQTIEDVLTNWNSESCKCVLKHLFGGFSLDDIKTNCGYNSTNTAKSSAGRCRLTFGRLLKKEGVTWEALSYYFNVEDIYKFMSWQLNKGGD